ncbi:cytochrome c oxidase subunit II [Pullulanibacillus sp. KACC 23026]|uniref:cytochrome c oxidase subunit II n=1 Tax=Pullulanibacillus sp. KACC 23026 TaxID=3028315 RepID=UPI0023B1BD66|nr:cytochrome c oxidase subunit II [Pullulanibacillus sp. KACC 23026]WEG11707.1 cytochrome c oxidase subunit II [Pullulanibacillus sp. KACC 23026]
MKKKWQRLLRLIPLAVIAIFTLVGCGKPGLSTLDPQGPVARTEAGLMLQSFLIMIIVVVVVGFLFTYALIRYRKRPGQEDVIPKQVEGNALLEVLWTVIPIILLVILAFPTVAKTFSVSDATVPKNHGDNVVVVKVTAHQYWWQFDYPDYGITTSEDLFIPTGKKVVLQVTSADVIHSFWVPALAGKLDANPGQTDSMYLTADKPGTYAGRCAELCGASHALMYFNVRAVSPSDFTAWTKEMKAGPSAPATASAQKGESLFKQDCMACHAVGVSGSNTAPNLRNFADQKNIAGFLPHDKSTLEKWIKDPTSLKPGALMPSRGIKGNLTDQQISDIADYLFTLSVKHNQ